MSARMLCLLLLVGFAYGFLRYQALSGERDLALLEINKLTIQLESLQQENDRLSRINDLSAAPLVAHRDHSPATTNHTIASAQVEYPANEFMQGADSFVDQILTRINTRADSALFADMATPFSDEAIDLDWAKGQEEIISAAFDSESLNQLVPESILCKSTRCQIRIPSADPGDASAISVKVSTAITSIPRLSQTRITSRFNPESSAVELLFFRNNDH